MEYVTENFTITKNPDYLLKLLSVDSNAVNKFAKKWVLKPIVFQGAISQELIINPFTDTDANRLLHLFMGDNYSYYKPYSSPVVELATTEKHFVLLVNTLTGWKMAVVNYLTYGSNDMDYRMTSLDLLKTGTDQQVIDSFTEDVTYHAFNVESLTSLVKPFFAPIAADVTTWNQSSLFVQQDMLIGTEVQNYITIQKKSIVYGFLTENGLTSIDMYKDSTLLQKVDLSVSKLVIDNIPLTEIVDYSVIEIPPQNLYLKLTDIQPYTKRILVVLERQ